ncbi:arginine--tRNA ligase [Candidatus Woesearchaeota archaeon]|nr:arginine--tRNA ligase [Candidatus Woesearchaeota archaeon]
MNFKEEFANLLSRYADLEKEEIINLIEVPRNSYGDLAFPVFSISKNPNKTAEEIAKKLSSASFEKFQNAGPYINAFIKKEKFVEETLDAIGKDYGKSNLGKGRTIVIDFSAPNIAKPFSVGHLRSTVIGNSLHKLYSNLGYRVIGVNHLGDWGTQFGKLITAYKKWGNEKELAKDPIKYLLGLYVKFHKEAESDKSLEDEARNEFRNLEKDNRDSVDLWKKFRDLSLKEFDKVYSLLNIKFDSYNGEAFYRDMLEDTIKRIRQRTEIENSDGALIVNLKEYGMPPLIIQKSNESTSYHTRDIAAALYRLKTYNPERIIYVVGSEQKLHFRQLFKTLELMGEDISKFVHVEFGLFRFSEGRMSTRKGNVVFLEDVLNESISLAEKTIAEKNPDLKDRKNTARIIGIGAVIFGDLSNNRIKNIEFDLKKILSFEGGTGPYIQYTHARICSILRKSKLASAIDYSKYSDDEFQLVKKLSEFPEVISDSALRYKPNLLCTYLIQLAQSFNTYYSKNEIKTSKERVFLISKIKQVLGAGMNLLGMEALKRM